MQPHTSIRSQVASVLRTGRLVGPDVFSERISSEEAGEVKERFSKQFDSFLSQDNSAGDLDPAVGRVHFRDEGKSADIKASHSDGVSILSIELPTIESHSYVKTQDQEFLMVKGIIFHEDDGMENTVIMSHHFDEAKESYTRQSGAGGYGPPA